MSKAKIHTLQERYIQKAKMFHYEIHFFPLCVKLLVANEYFCKQTTSQYIRRNITIITKQLCFQNITQLFAQSLFSKS